MPNLFNPVFFSVLIFLGILVPLFIFGVSSALNSIEKSKEGIKIKQEEIDKKVAKDIEAMERELEDCRKKKLVKKSQKISKEIYKLNAIKKKLQLQSLAILKRYELINYRDGVSYPSIFILLSIGFTILGIKCVSPIAALVSYFFVFLFLLLGIFRIVKCLNIIRDAMKRSKNYEEERIRQVFQRTFALSDKGTDKIA